MTPATNLQPSPDLRLDPPRASGAPGADRGLARGDPGRAGAPGYRRLRAGPVPGRALSLAREALEQFRLELSAAKFDLDITRREREGLRRLIEREG